jgi:hypothetical protein
MAMVSRNKTTRASRMNEEKEHYFSPNSQDLYSPPSSLVVCVTTFLWPPSSSNKENEKTRIFK